MSTAFLIFLAPLYVIAALVSGACWALTGLLIFNICKSYRHYRRKQKARR